MKIFVFPLFACFVVINFCLFEFPARRWLADVKSAVTLWRHVAFFRSFQEFYEDQYLNTELGRWNVTITLSNTREALSGKADFLKKREMTFLLFSIRQGIPANWQGRKSAVIYQNGKIWTIILIMWWSLTTSLRLSNRRTLNFLNFLVWIRHFCLQNRKGFLFRWRQRIWFNTNSKNVPVWV